MKMTVKNISKCTFLAAMLALGLWASDASAVTQKTVYLTAGKADTITLDSAAADVLIANPGIADVGPLRSDRIFVVGKTVGDTNVLAFDSEGKQLADIAVRVRVDEGSLKDTFAEFFPDENIDVRTVKDNIVLTGSVSTPAVANQVRDFASRFVSAQGKTIVDLMTVEGEQQVMLKVKVLEARRSALREYGIETDYRVGRGNFIDTNPRVGMQSLLPFATGQIMINSNGDLGPFEVALDGLERDGLVNTLAEPNLTAISGETAGFLAGGEFPVPSGRDQQGNVTLEFKQFGVSLNFTPTIMSSERISLQLSTEVSAKSDDDSVTLVNTRIPGLTVRRAETTVQMGSGGTIMIAGLIKSDTLNNMNGVPGVQDLPILGELFKSKSFARNESELLILVTPYIVKPYKMENAIKELPVEFERQVQSAQPPALPVPSKDEKADKVVFTDPDRPRLQKKSPEPRAGVGMKPVLSTAVATPATSKSFADSAKKTVQVKKPPLEIKPPAGGFGYLVD